MASENTNQDHLPPSGSWRAMLVKSRNILILGESGSIALPISAGFGTRCTYSSSSIVLFHLPKSDDFAAVSCPDQPSTGPRLLIANGRQNGQWNRGISSSDECI
jgi:hypothetical protein